MKLIPDWRRAWRWWSVHFAAIGAMLTGLPMLAPDGLQALWNSLPGELRQVIPPHIGRAITFALFLLVIVARLIQQRRAANARQPH